MDKALKAAAAKSAEAKARRRLNFVKKKTKAKAPPNAAAIFAAAKREVFRPLFFAQKKILYRKKAAIAAKTSAE